jgi:hypothetical protein
VQDGTIDPLEPVVVYIDNSAVAGKARNGSGYGRARPEVWRALKQATAFARRSPRHHVACFRGYLNTADYVVYERGDRETWLI